MADGRYSSELLALIPATSLSATDGYQSPPDQERKARRRQASSETAPVSADEQQDPAPPSEHEVDRLA